MQLIITADSAIVPTPAGRAELASFVDVVTATVQEAAAARARIEEFGEDVISMDSGEDTEICEETVISIESGEVWRMVTQQHRCRDM